MVHIRTLVLGTVILSCAVVLPNTTRAQGLDLKAEEEDIKIGGREYSPYLNRGYPQRSPATLSVTMVYPPPGRLIYQGNSPTLSPG